MDKAKRRRFNAVIERQSWLLPEDLLLPIFAYLDVKTLIEKKQVSRSWRVNCTAAIDAMRTITTRKAFSTKEELREAVKKYGGYNETAVSHSQQRVYSWSHCNPQEAEEIAQTYGYPINKWDVSNLKDFSGIFFIADTFNEDISSWNVSNATTMHAMFHTAGSFNQDLSLWNVSNVEDMTFMFSGASSFNHSLSGWDVSSVCLMKGMFAEAINFDQDLSDWNVASGSGMHEMF
jgi:surface protein